MPGVLEEPTQQWDASSGKLLKLQVNADNLPYLRGETGGYGEESCCQTCWESGPVQGLLSYTTRILRKDKDSNVRSRAEDVEGHLSASDLCPA